MQHDPIVLGPPAVDIQNESARMPWAAVNNRGTAETTRELRAAPYSGRCAQILHRGEHILLGVSPSNAFFSQHNIAAAIRWARRHTDRIAVITTDVEQGRLTYLARGYDGKRATDRAKRDTAQFRNRIRRALQAAQTDPDAVPVHYCVDFRDDPGYVAARRHFGKLLDDADFFRTCLQMISTVICHHRKDEQEPTARHIDYGLEYMAIEIPIFIDAPAILDVPSSVWAYNSFPGFCRHFYCAGAPFQRNADQGFVKLEPA